MVRGIPAIRWPSRVPPEQRPADVEVLDLSQRTVMNSGASRMEIVAVLAFLLLFIALQVWILPRFGVST